MSSSVEVRSFGLIDNGLGKKVFYYEMCNATIEIYNTDLQRHLSEVGIPGEKGSMLHLPVYFNHPRDEESEKTNQVFAKAVYDYYSSNETRLYTMYFK